MIASKIKHITLIVLPGNKADLLENGLKADMDNRPFFMAVFRQVLRLFF
ncbi:MAG: hypothetical protein Q7V32_05770 [Methylicorpusculum sp.]|nr:hypothetical protein [Methylicorpusculum sp.]